MWHFLAVVDHRTLLLMSTYNRLTGLQPMTISPLKLLFWQQTGLALQEPPPRMGEQVSPTSTLMSERTMPSKPRTRPAALEEAFPTELQH